MTRDPVNICVVVRRLMDRALTSPRLERRHPKGERHRTPDELVVPKTLPDPLRETQQRRLDLREIERVLVERVRVPDRFRRRSIADHVCVVDPVRAVPDVDAVLAESCVQSVAIEAREVADRAKTPARQDLARLWAHSPEALERQRRAEPRL